MLSANAQDGYAALPIFAAIRARLRYDSRSIMAQNRQEYPDA
jgi:hypothetical protein